MSNFPFWIKERRNPQLGVYFEPMGKMSKTAAKHIENTKYGTNIMRDFATEESYKDAIQRLKAAGEKIN